jgi:hypothetical protein
VEARCVAACPGAGHVYVVEDRRPASSGLWCYCACPAANGVPAEYSFLVSPGGDARVGAELELGLWRAFEQRYCP